MRKCLLLILFFYTGFFCLHAQQILFKSYTMQDGLVANPVRCIYQDGKGFVWIGTFEGLSRYDGFKFTNYTNTNGLSHNLINSIIEVNGKLLIAENNGAVDIIQNNSFQKGFTAPSAVNIIQPYRDRLLVTTDSNGFYEYRDETFVLPSQERTGTSLGHFVPLNDSFLLAAGIDDHLIIYKNNLSVHLLQKNNFNSHFYSLFKDSKKRIWACTSGGLKLIEFSAGKKNLLSFAPLPSAFNFTPLKNAQVTSMIEDKDGSFWIGTMKGLVHLFPNGNSHTYNEKEGLPSAIINTLYRDKENNLWIGTERGLAKWVSKSNVVFYNTEYKDFKNDVNQMYVLGNKQIVLGTEHGLQQFNVHTKEFKDINATGSHYVPIRASSPLLVQYEDKLGQLDSIKNTIIPVKKIDSIMQGVTSSCRHPDGTIFLGTFGGLFTVEKTAIKKILPYRITCMLIDKDGNTWAGTWIDGLYRITAKNNSPGSYNVQDITSTINQKQIRGLYEESNKNIWVGTRYAGAFCLTEKGHGKFNVQHFSRQSGLISDWVKSFAETESGDIWVGSYLGLDKLVKEPAGYRVFNFSKVVNFFADIKNIVSTGDNEWVCVANTGIAFFKDDNIHQVPPLRATVLSTSLGVLENKLTIILPTEKISLKPNQNAARFEFSALGFINERQILYSYRLKGSGDTTWSKPENIHEASYVSLSPGHYTFEVKAIGWNGEYGIPATFPFHIATPFWKQGWFVALCIFAVILLIYGLYRYRIRQLVRLQNVRNSIATDLHDDIGSSLTNISILSELSSQSFPQPEKAQRFLQRISEEVQASNQAMDDIIWSVNSHNDSLQETMARMRRYAAELFEKSEINCHLQLDEDKGDKKLSMEQRRDVYLICKEALNNIRKHARANNVWMEVRKNRNHLFMQIKDDGKGFNPNLITHRNGLKNLRSRVEKWNGDIKIQSQENKGTAIEIKIPLKE